jgi:flagellar biosynthesis/type III secretory pathway protein FliH
MSPAVHSVPLTQSLRSVRFAVASVSEEAAVQRLQTAESLAAERGRVEGEKHLSEQLERLRADMLGLQQGVLESLRRAIPQVVRDSEQALAALALEVARKLVARAGRGIRRVRRSFESRRLRPAGAVRF